MEQAGMMENLLCGSKELNTFGHLSDAQWKEGAGQPMPYLREVKVPNHVLLDYLHHGKASLDGRRVALARAELEIQPEVLLKDLLTLPDLQHFSPLQPDPEPLETEWKLAPPHFELVLDRGPFTNRLGRMARG
ncbi:hypothetical protein RvY_03157 [Ramazzottius varieornatus]|uniref:Uncharacterized protein n=1 Tax=Ramazzottius varieornatus TaxID=947166 RepID=A0A1D1UU52_RAMVA|nr:hypothetical protein RvY_03157 [Ramazzottius varieornatus]